MKKKYKLHWFLVSRFILILLVVAVIELLLNLFYSYTLFPWIEQNLEISQLEFKRNGWELLSAFIRSLLWLVVSGLTRELPSLLAGPVRDLLDDWSGETLVGQIAGHVKGMPPGEARLYAFAVLAFSLLLLLLWLLPYIAAAFIYSRIVAKQVARLEQEEQRQREAYERQRNLLLSDMAHDLKTPITTVSGYAKALAEGAVGQEKQQEYLEAVYQKSMQMDELITLLFEYVKLDSAGFSLKKAREDIPELLRESIARLYSDLEEHEVTLELEIPEEPVTAEVDKIQLQRVISNLVTNAIRHNPPGITLWIRMKAEEEGITLSVSDNGPPIQAEMAEHIFEPFVLADTSRGTGRGSGLGLSIARKIIEMHGGTLELVQRPSRKTFLINLRKEAAAK